MRDGEEGLQLGERSLVDAVDETLQRAEKPAIGDEQHRQYGGKRGGQHAFLHAQLVGQRRGVVDLKLPGDGGADFHPLDLGGIADADGVDRLAGAVAEGDNVAVGGKPLADAVGDGEAIGA